MKEKKDTVLVVDDEPANLGLLFEHLRRADFRVLIAKDGASALERVKRLPPDIIILDIKLPNTNGFEVYNRLKEHTATQDTPIIFMTAMTETADKVKAFDLDAADYVTKPFQPEKVVARVEKHLAIHALQKSLEEKSTQLEREIAERAQAEDTLTQSNQLLETILDHTHMLVAYLDPQLNFIRVNRAYAEADEREPSFFPGKNHFDLYPNAENEAIFCRVAETGEPHFAHAKPFEYAENPERDVSHWDWSLIPIKDKEIVTGLVLTLANVTERVQAEEALHKSDARYRAVVQAQADLIYRYAPDGTITFANDAYCQFYSKALDEIIGTDHFDKIPDEEREAVSKHIASLSAAKPLGTNECRNINSRGESYWNHWTDQAIFDHDGNVIEYQAVGRDITERMRAEQELESIFDSTGYLICVADIQGHFKRLNATWEPTLGYSPKELMSKPFLDFVHPDDRDKTMAVIQEKLSRGIEVIQFENRYRCQDGSYKWLSWTSRPVVEEDIVYAIAYDVTERVQAEAHRDATLGALRESEEKFRSLAENSRDYIMRYDEQGRHLYQNAAAYKVSGLSEKEFVGKTHRELGFDKDLCELLEQKIAWVFRSGEPTGKVFEWESAEGAVFLDWRLYPEFDKDGKVKTVLGISRDITELKRAEKELKAHSELLEDMVSERTRELYDAQEKLVRQEKLTVLGQMAGGVAHELRNPLGVIKNSAYFLNMVLEAPDSEVKEALSILDKEVGTCDKIITSLLDFARTKSLDQQELDVDDVLQATLARADIPRRVELVYELREGLPTVLADPEQLKVVLGNIIRNAVQAMPEGGRLSISAQATDSEWVAVSIGDTGVGIPGENLDKLFEPLFSTKAKGIGLGLALVKNLVDANKGRIEVQSEQGAGSTFTVSLPIQTAMP